MRVDRRVVYAIFLLGAPLAVLEVECRSSGSEQCRFLAGSAETLATTYAALLSLQRKKLIEPEKADDPTLLSWKVTKAGKAAISEKPSRR